MPDIISVIIALVLVIVAAVHDLREFRIPNRLIVAGIVAGVSVIVIRAFTGEYIGNYILGTLVGLAGMIFLYIIRAVGAGDVKLLAVIGMLTGLDFVLQLMAVSLITGLFTGIVELFLKKTREVSMGRNNICVIYDSDENYAKRLMSVINDDNDIPYNAQVFTKEHELDKYLQEKEADMLMICEGAYGYNAYRTGNKTVVLCEEEREADEINSREEKGLVGICKYQPSYQLLQSVMRYEKKDRVQKRGSLKVTGVYGFNNTARMMLSLAVARLMSEHGNTLFINFETFYGFKGILKGEENENLSDALYAFRQNHNQFHKNIVNAISHYERLDYIPDASCAEDIDDIKPEEMGTFIQAIGRELGYSNIVIDIGDGIRMPWNMMDCCDEIYMCETGNYIENMRLKNFEKYLLEQGMDNIAATFKNIHVNEDENINNDDIWGRLPFCSFYEELCRTAGIEEM